MNLKGKKVLVFGLGLLGGGLATVNWLLKQGAKVTVTDKKSAKELEASVKKIEGDVVLHLGGHNMKDIEENEVVVVNPGISVFSEYVQYAKKLKKRIENEATLFYKFSDKPIVTVTGTRGKTTTVNWINHFLKSKYKSRVGGNAYSSPLMQLLSESDYSVVVNEIPSFHLELFDSEIRGADVAVITNIYRDHLDRYPSFEDYAETKANIFKWQNKEQDLILNRDNEWTDFFLEKKPVSKIWFFSMKKLPENSNGVFFENNSIFFQLDGTSKKVLNLDSFEEVWGSHNIENLLTSSLAANLKGISWDQIQANLETLPQIPFRQEKIFENKKITVINDTAATSPDGGIAAVKRFGSPSCVLITGGTDKELDYGEWAQVVSQSIDSQNIVFLSGSATKKMLKGLANFVTEPEVLETLTECVKKGLEKADNYENSVLLFSPASKSFEKFRNEFDRGGQFNKIIKEHL